MFILEMARNGMVVAARHAATETAVASRMAAAGTATISIHCPLELFRLAQQLQVA